MNIEFVKKKTNKKEARSTKLVMRKFYCFKQSAKSSTGGTFFLVLTLFKIKIVKLLIDLYEVMFYDLLML